jgi:hypothetical protein
VRERRVEVDDDRLAGAPVAFATGEVETTFGWAAERHGLAANTAKQAISRERQARDVIRVPRTKIGERVSPVAGAYSNDFSRIRPMA